MKHFADAKVIGFVLDLRFADGTNFDAAAAVASRFLSDGQELFTLKSSEKGARRASGTIGRALSLFVQTNGSLRREILRVFDSTFAITYALEAIAVFVAILGVAATLITLILERRRELAILRLVGADRRQMRKMVVIEATLMGAASQIIGIGVGLVLSLLLIFVINVQSFGWTIQFHLPGISNSSRLADQAAERSSGF